MWSRLAPRPRPSRAAVQGHCPVPVLRVNGHVDIGVDVHVHVEVQLQLRLEPVSDAGFWTCVGVVIADSGAG